MENNNNNKSNKKDDKKEDVKENIEEKVKTNVLSPNTKIEETNEIDNEIKKERKFDNVNEVEEEKVEEDDDEVEVYSGLLKKQVVLSSTGVLKSNSKIEVKGDIKLQVTLQLPEIICSSAPSNSKTLFSVKVKVLGDTNENGVEGVFCLPSFKRKALGRPDLSRFIGGDSPTTTKTNGEFEFQIYFTSGSIIKEFLKLDFYIFNREHQIISNNKNNPITVSTDPFRVVSHHHYKAHGYDVNRNPYLGGTIKNRALLDNPTFNPITEYIKSLATGSEVEMIPFAEMLELRRLLLEGVTPNPIGRINPFSDTIISPGAIFSQRNNIIKDDQK